MKAKTPVFDAKIEILKELNLRKGGYAVHGSGPMAVRKIRDVKDLDVLVTLGTMAELGVRLCDTPTDAEHGMTLKHRGIEFLDKLNYGNAADVISRAEEIDGVMYATLQDVSNWKICMGRPKDVVDVNTIDVFLRRRRR